MNIKEIDFKYPCAKQTVVAILVNGNRQFIGTNRCDNDIPECPREGMERGTGYELCQDLCKQKQHAEEAAIELAGEYAKGSVLFLIGHFAMCPRCSKAVKEAGVAQVVIVDDLIAVRRVK